MLPEQILDMDRTLHKSRQIKLEHCNILIKICEQHTRMLQEMDLKYSGNNHRTINTLIFFKYKINIMLRAFHNSPRTGYSKLIFIVSVHSSPILSEPRFITGCRVILFLFSVSKLLP